MNETYLQVLAAAAPAIVLAMVMIRRDKQREPIGWLLAAAGLGALVVPAVLLLDCLGWPDFGTDSFIGAILSAFVTAAIPEEGFKFLALFILASRCKHFDEMFDGVVYAVCIGIGFACVENLLYVCGDDEWIFVGISRALTAVPMHYFFAVVMGAFFSLGWFDKRNRKVYFASALLLPIIIHGVYDTICFSIELDDDFSTLCLVAFLLLFRYIRRYVKALTNSMLKLDNHTSI